jgi:rRNA biogenesis protein RRP5
MKSFNEGDRVKAVIMSIDLEKKRIAFSLKPSRFDPEDFDMEEAASVSADDSVNPDQDTSPDEEEGQEDEDVSEESIESDMEVWARS